jgi:hypothetical protein
MRFQRPAHCHIQWLATGCGNGVEVIRRWNGRVTLKCALFLFLLAFQACPAACALALQRAGAHEDSLRGLIAI